MKTKTTIKDIAQAAGVSVATVSYVLNNRTEQRISDETRKKVLQIINLLDYTPNQSAVALATNRSQNIAVALPSNVDVLTQSEQLYFIDTLSTMLMQRGYRLMHLACERAVTIPNADAIICYDYPEEAFRLLGEENMIPLLAFDTKIDDWLFYQVLTDYSRLKREADEFFNGSPYDVVSLSIHSEHMLLSLQEVFPDVRFISTLKDLNSYSSRNILSLNHTLSVLLKEENNVYAPSTLSQDKMNALISCMEATISRVTPTEHNIVI